MSDRPEGRPEDRPRRGPLGDEEETGRGTVGGSEEDAATRRVRSARDGRDDAAGGPPEAEEDTQRRRHSEEAAATRVVRTRPGADDDEDLLPYSREERLRDIYGGVDWLASFVGCVFALVFGGLLLAVLSGLVLAPLGFTLDLAGQQINAAIVAGLAVVGAVLFLSYLIGGYIAGRLVRFDGGRNGLATVAWGLLFTVLFAFFGFLLAGLLPGAVFDSLQGFVQGAVRPAIGDLVTLGLAGLGIIAGALLLELLGGFIGGRLGNRYHTRIDETS